MIQTDDSWYVVRNTPGVTGFVGSTGSGSKPTALLPEEVESILKHMGMEEPKENRLRTERNRTRQGGSICKLCWLC